MIIFDKDKLAKMKEQAAKLSDAEKKGRPMVEILEQTLDVGQRLLDLINGKPIEPLKEPVTNGISIIAVSGLLATLLFSLQDSNSASIIGRSKVLDQILEDLGILSQSAIASLNIDVDEYLRTLEQRSTETIFMAPMPKDVQ